MEATVKSKSTARHILGSLAYRSLRAAAVSFWVMVISFGLLRLAPGDPVLARLGAEAEPAAIERLRRQLRLDVDPVTQSDAVALLGYEAMIGSEFDKRHGWHVNLMPSAVLSEMPADWMQRASRKHYGLLEVLVPKLKRGEPRDKLHAEWAKKLQ